MKTRLTPEQAARLRQAREMAEVGLRHLAENLGYAASTFSRVESGSSQPSKRLLEKWLRFLSINEHWLKTGDLPVFVAPGTASNEEPYGILVTRMSKIVSEASANISQFSKLMETIQISPKPPLTDVPVSRNNANVVSTSELQELLARLRTATEKRGAQAELARTLGVSRAHVSEWLSGSVEPSGETTLRLLRWVEKQERGQTKPIG